MQRGQELIPLGVIPLLITAELALGLEIVIKIHAIE